jgi:cyclophilin family peptidyl-prolyl cis-trans isomerase
VATVTAGTSTPLARPRKIGVSCDRLPSYNAPLSLKISAPRSEVRRSEHKQGGEAMRRDVVTSVGLALWIAGSCLSLTGCGGGGGGDVPSASISPSNVHEQTPRAPGSSSQDPITLVPAKGDYRSPASSPEELHPEVAIKTNLGTMRVRLNWEKAPRTVANFLHNYVETGFYDQTIFHHVESGYLIAGGGYTAELEEKETQPPIPCEADNQLSNRRGTIAMARPPAYAGSATSQFFINLVDNPGLDYQPGDPNGINGYCVFGEVVEGMEVVDRIAQVPIHSKNGLTAVPVESVVVESITRLK